MAWGLEEVRLVLVITYTAVGCGSLLVQSVRRFGKVGPALLAPLLLAGLALVATRHSISPFPWDIAIGLGGSLCAAVVLATRGQIERFVDPAVLPERLRVGTGNDATLVQTKAISVWLLLSVPLLAVLLVE